MRFRFLAGAALCAALSLPALGQDLTISGFGTVGWTQSNQHFTYLRSVREGGTFDRDSVIGLQGDVQFNPQWSATVQLKAANSPRHDGAWTVMPAWAFVGWRPDNNWQIRVGRLRVPFYLHSESRDVGVTHDYAHLPTEVYGYAPTNDFDGLYVTRTWGQRDGDELSLDVYAGGVSTNMRFWYANGFPPLLPPGAIFPTVDVKAQGAVLTFRQPDALWRTGLHHINPAIRGLQVPTTFPFVPVAPGIGYFKTVDALPGPDIPKADSVNTYLFDIGFEKQLSAEWRVSAEFIRTIQRDTIVGADMHGAYVALFRRFGAFTPYISVGQLSTSKGTLELYDALTKNPLPSAIPGADAINAAQRVAAESYFVFDQRSVALGGSYALNPSRKLKFEWQRTRIGRASSFVDSPPGLAPVSNTNIDTLSLSYNFAF